MPVNHFFVVAKALADTRPDVVREIYRMLQASKAARRRRRTASTSFPFGVEANRKPLELVIGLRVEQKIIPRASRSTSCSTT